MALQRKSDGWADTYAPDASTAMPRSARAQAGAFPLDLGAKTTAPRAMDYAISYPPLARLGEHAVYHVSPRIAPGHICPRCGVQVAPDGRGMCGPCEGELRRITRLTARGGDAYENESE